MYLRTTSRKNRDGSVTKYFQLAHNERDPDTGRPVARIIHSFGRADKLDRDDLVRLCRSIARVCGLEVVDSLEENYRGRGRLPADVKLLKTYEFGTIQAIGAIWEEFGLGEKLREIMSENNASIPYDQALLAMTANRLCSPESKLGVWDRWLDDVYLPGCDSLSLRHMYEAMDLLHEHAEEVEKKIFFKTANLLNLMVDIIFYDTTTASFSVDYGDEEDGPRQYGHAKEGYWKPQVVVALAVTREGIPVRSWVFPGNTADVTTVEQVKKDLKGWQLGRALFVGDSGMNSRNNRQELAKSCGKYLLASRMASSAEIKHKVMSHPGRYKKIQDNLQAKEVILGDGEKRKRYILCYNSSEAERQHRHRQELIAWLEEELASHKNKSATAQWAIDLLASRRFKRYLTTTEKGKIRIDRAAVKEAAKYDGKWVIETNDDTLSVEDAACGYRSLMVIERCFRSLKRTQIQLTPMYHWTRRRIEAHVKICVLSLLIERIAELRCNQSWKHIRRTLAGVQATKFQTGDHTFFQINELEKSAENIYKNLGIPLPRRVYSIRTAEKEGAIT